MASPAVALTFAFALLCLTTYATATSQTLDGKSKSKSTTHVLFIVADDHGFHDCSFTGSDIQTPTIDKLRSQGIALEQHYVQKVCSPTRTAIMTGRYPHRNGMQTPFCGGAAEGLNLNETMMSEYMNSAGYVSHIVGKWHLGFTAWEHTPTFRGFSSFYGFYGCAQDYYLHGSVGSLDFHHDKQPNCGENCSEPQFAAVGTCSMKNNNIKDYCTGHAPTDMANCVACDDVEHYSTILFGVHARATIAAYDPTAAPLFLYLPSQDTHGPSDVPLIYVDRVSDNIKDPVRRQLAAKLSVLDELIKNVTEALEEKGMLKNTLIVYTADNGGPIKQSIPGNTDAIGASNYPLRGGKHNAYEGGVRSTAWISGAPLDAAVVAAGGVAPSSSPDQDFYWGLMHAVDWVPTLANVAGYVAVPRVAGIKLDGIDHWHALITNTSSPRTSIILDIEKPNVISRWGDVGSGVVRNGSYKLHIGDAGQLIRPGDWSPPDAFDNVSASEPTPFCTHFNIATSTNCAPYQLFDVIEDPSERNDLFGKPGYDDIVANLKAIYETERAVAVYPCIRGPEGKPNKEGVLQPWLSPNDKCEHAALV
eukprot:m.101165 g.101165  ORF g.101165 m.101165 type:complete len:589 (-) comp27310_c0_seq1:204-1970(-)